MAVIGCLHGELSKTYEDIQLRDQKDQMRTSILIICGDFQAIRHTDDLKTIAIPHKYLTHTGDFYKYYHSKKIAPILTLVIGGNHEASHHMRELNFGGFLCPNIYFLGAAGVVNIKPIIQNTLGLKGSELKTQCLRILGISGIFKPYSFFQDHPKIPFDKDSKRDCYHVRQLEILRSLMLKNQNTRTKMDICIGHDWPRGAQKYGNYQQLIKLKPFFEDDFKSGKFGNPASTLVLNTIQP